MLKGTKFQIMVWNELKKIPKGEVRTYKEIALAIGNQILLAQLQMHVGKTQDQLKYPVIE